MPVGTILDMVVGPLKNPMDSKTSAQWAAYGFVEDVYLWQRYITDPKEAAEWRAIVGSPILAADWIGVRINNPAIALRWIEAGKDVKAVRRWTIAGVKDPKVALDWMDLNQDLEDVLGWHRYGVERPDECRDLLNKGLSLDLIRGFDLSETQVEFFEPWLSLRTQEEPAAHSLVNTWIRDGGSVDDAAPWVNVGSTPWEREIFISKQTPLDLVSALVKGMSAKQAMQTSSFLTSYLNDDRLTISELEQWEVVGLSALEMNPWVAIGATSQTVLDWRVTELDPIVAQHLCSLGFSPLDWINSGNSLKMSERTLSKWAESNVPRNRVRDWIFAGCEDPGEAVSWLSAFSYSTPNVPSLFKQYRGDLLAAKKARRDSEKEAVKEAKALEKEAADREKKAQRIIAEAEAQRRLREQETLLAKSRLNAKSNQKVTTQNVRTANTGLPDVSEEWLEEVIARAITTRPSHRKVSHWPSVLELDEDGISIEIVFLEGLIHGTVVRDGKSQYCAFEPSNFEPENYPETDQGRLVLGLCICWFIDCSIVIPGLNKSSQTRPYSIVGAKPNLSSSRCRYVPTLTFRNRREISISDSDRLLVRHKVSGHLRALGYGRKGSSEARGNAPVHLRREMKSNETFVRPHFRGTEKERGELVTRLSRYSATADALAELG